MVTLLFIFTALSCTTGRYILYKERKTWFEAQNICRSNHSDLATVVNLDQNSLITTLETKDFAWIGLYDDATKWMWSNGNTDLGRTGFTNWKTSNPDYNTIYPTHTRICVSMDGNGFWDDRDCAYGLPRVCYEDPNYYIFINHPMTWSNSQQDCISRKTHLTSVRDEQEFVVVKNKISTPSWIGLYRYTWVHWSDSTFSAFSNWNDRMNYYLNTSADFHCAMVHIESGTWYRASCYSKHPFICNTVQSSTQLTGSSSGSSQGISGSVGGTYISGGGSSGPGEEISRPGEETSGPGEETSGPGEETSGPGEVTSGSDVVISSYNNGGTFKTGYISRVKFSLKTGTTLNRRSIKHQILQQIHAKLGEKVTSNFMLRWIQNDGPRLDTKHNKLSCNKYW